MNLEHLTSQVCDVAREAGAFIKSQSSLLKAPDIREKGMHNFVTFVDEQAEQIILKRLSSLLPGCGFIAEESPGLERHEYTWIVDPLDGTTNFIHGLPLHCVSIALSRGENLISGVIYELGQDECFFTWDGASSYLNGREIHVSETNRVLDGLFATGFPYYDYSRLDPYIEFFKYMMQHSRGIRRLGSAAADLAWVACGRFDGFYEYGLQPWDVAAGSLIVKNAGGCVADFTGGNHFLFGKEIITTNAAIFEEFMNTFGNYFQLKPNP